MIINIVYWWYNKYRKANFNYQVLNRCYSLDIFSKLNDKPTDKILNENKKNNQFNIITQNFR